jgi:hypothetical protein
MKQIIYKSTTQLLHEAIQNPVEFYDHTKYKSAQEHLNKAIKNQINERRRQNIRILHSGYYFIKKESNMSLS